MVKNVLRVLKPQNFSNGCYLRFGTCHSPWSSYIADTKDPFVYELYYRYNSVLIPHILLYRSLLSAVYGRIFLFIPSFTSINIKNV